MTLEIWYLAMNPTDKAIQLLIENMDKITEDSWDFLSDNPNIFKLDYEQMKKNFEPLAKEIIEVACHPNRIRRLMKQYNFDFEDWFN
jgi:hypothetical protein